MHWVNHQAWIAERERAAVAAFTLSFSRSRWTLEGEPVDNSGGFHSVECSVTCSHSMENIDDQCQSKAFGRALCRCRKTTDSMAAEQISVPPICTVSWFSRGLCICQLAQSRPISSMRTLHGMVSNNVRYAFLLFLVRCFMPLSHALYYRSAARRWYMWHSDQSSR